MSYKTYNKRGSRMDTVGAALVKEIEVEEIVERLDGFYCYNLVLAYFCYALGNRLEGQASFLLGTS